MESTTTSGVVKRMKFEASNLTLFPPPPPPPEEPDNPTEKSTEPSKDVIDSNEPQLQSTNSAEASKTIDVPPESIELPTSSATEPKENLLPCISTPLEDIPSPEDMANPPKEAKDAHTEQESGTTESQPPTSQESPTANSKSDPVIPSPQPSGPNPPAPTNNTASIPMPTPSVDSPTSAPDPVGPTSTTPAPETPAFPTYPRLPPPLRPPFLHLRGGPHPPFPGPRIGIPRMPPRLPPPPMGPPRPDLMMVPPVPPGIPSDLWEWFFHSDEDKDGRITAGEVQRLLLKGKWSPFKEETCKMMLDMMDIDKIGTIDAYQMTSLWNSLLDWKNIFDELETDKRGCLNASQMFKALEKFGYRLSSEFCDAVVDRFATDHDEKGGEPVLSFDDFIQTRVMLKSLTESFQIFDTAKAGVIDLHYEQFLEMVLTNAM